MKNFTEIENSVVITKYLHKIEHLVVEDDIDEDSLDLYSFSYNDDITKDWTETVNHVHNIASTRELFKIFCLAKLSSIFPNLYLVV